MAETKGIKGYEIGFRELIENNNDQPNVVFLDGLDEFFMTKSLSDSDVLLFLNNCKNLLNKHEELYFVITSRFNYVETSKLYNEDCLLFSLGVLDEQQQCDLVQKYISRTGDEKECNLSPQLLKEVNKQGGLKHIKELVELPILLMMILISKTDIEEAGSRAKVYDTLFTTVLNRKWDTDKRLKKYKTGNRFKKEHLREYISFLAFKVFQYNKGYLNKSEITEFEETKHFIDKRLRIENEDGHLKEVLKDILTSFYLKESLKPEHDRKRGDESYDYAIEFLHKSLYEYLACEYLWNATKDFFTEKDPKDPDECKTLTLKQVQQKMQELFACTSMTAETVEYMEEIVRRDTEKHELLSERMSSFLPELLRKGFLYDYRADSNTGEPFFTAEKQALNIFHNYWLILGNLNVHLVQDINAFDAKWDVLIEDEIFKESKAEMINAFKAELEAAKKSAFSIGLIDLNIEKETENFMQWLEKPTTAPKQKFSYTQYWYWVRSFLFHREGKEIFSALHKRVVKRKEAFLNLLQLTGASKMPMRLSLYFAPLSQEDLSNIIANEIKLSGADLRSADLSSAYLFGADLSSANLFGANLRSAYLSSANLFGANLRSAYLSSANLFGANLRSADLRSANLFGANLSSANLFGADLRSANLSSADLFGADLRSANLSSANLFGANLRSADLRSANLSSADLSSADLFGADLRSADLSSANLSSANLSSADLSSANLSSSVVDSPDWLDQLKTWKVNGLEWVLENYIISKEKGEFSDRFGDTFQGYEVLPKGET